MKGSLAIAISFLAFTGFSQNDGDIYRYSKHFHAGTARFEAMGGAFGALGADLSAGQINPAAMGRFSSSQVSLSLGPQIYVSDADFQGQLSETSRTSFSVPNFGVVFTNDISNRNKGDLYSQLSIGMNRIANFNQRFNYTGEQYESLLDVFGGQAAGYLPEELSTFFPFSTSLAWETYALDYNASDGTYYSHLNSADMLHNRTVNTKGGINEWYVSYSRNRMNRLYYGASMGLRFSKYTEEYTHSEAMTDTSTTSFRGFDYRYNLKTEGLGFNLKIGAIYLISDGFRIGAAFHSPTFSSMEDNWSADMVSYFADTTIGIPEQYIPVGNYKYRLNTPLKAVLSATYIIGLNACISADVEYVGYNMGRLRSTTDVAYEPYDYEFENQEAKRRLAPAMNYRVGAEYAIQQKLFLRAGFSLYGSGYKSSENVDNNPDLSVSGGLGYRIGNIAIDLSYVNRVLKRNYYAFPLSSAAIDGVTHTVTVTGSIRF